jgi:hypothetical protein
MRYKVLKQHSFEDRLFTLKDEDGNEFEVDFYSSGAFVYPDDVAETAESWRAWLGTFVGKTLEIEHITPYYYFTSGIQRVIDEAPTPSEDKPPQT